MVAALVGAQGSIVIGGIGCVVGITAIARLMPRFSAYVMRSSSVEDEGETCQAGDASTA